MQDLKLSVLINAVDKFTGPAKKIAAMSDRMAKKLNAGSQELKQLADQGKTLNQFQRLESRLGATAAKMDQAGKETASLGRKIASMEKPNRILINQFERAKRKSVKLKQEHKAQKQVLNKLRSELRSGGVDTRNLGSAQDRLAAKLQKTTGKMERLSQMSARAERAQERFDKVLQRGAHANLVAGGIANVGQGALNLVTGPIEQMRQVEKARGELASLGIKNIDAVADKGREVARKLAGINPGDFIAAAYDIKSGVATLDDVGVADITALSAVTAKATKGDLGQVTSLFATGFGVFKDKLFKDQSDQEFGEIFSASLASAVQQFKTDGGKMQVALQAMGSGLAQSGVSLAEQFTALGLLQQKMEAGASGTALKAVERSAAEAQKRFEKMNIAIQTLDENGNLRSLPDLLEEMQREFGEEYTTETGAIIQKAFGSDEAVTFFKALWGGQKAFRLSQKNMEQAQKQGEKFTETMARAMDNNMDARLTIMQQRWDLIQERIGRALIPVLERLLPVIESAANWVEKFVAGNQGLSTFLIAAVGGLGLIATVAAPAIMAISSLSIAVAFLGKTARKAGMNTAAGGIDFGGGGRRSGRGKGLKGLLGRARGFAGGKLGLLSAGLGVLSVGSTLLDSGKSAGEKAAAVTQDVGNIGGALGGAALGAAIGTAIFPVVGTAIGGLIGGIAGGSLGDFIGEKLGSLFISDDDDTWKDKSISPLEPVKKVIATAAVATALTTAPVLADNQPPSQTITNEQTYQITIHATAGQDEQAIARQVREQIEQIQDEENARRRSRLYDDE